MRRTNKYSRTLLVLVLFVAGLAGAMRPQSVAAQNSGTFGGTFSWNYDPGTHSLTITGSGDMPGFNDQPWGAFQEQIKKVTIGDGVTSVEEAAFDGCTALTSVTLPAGLKTIGEAAFYGCTALTSVTLPAGLQTIGRAAFAYCTELASIELPEGLQTLGTWAFAKCAKLASVTLPASLQTIGDDAFHECNALASIELPAALQTIGENALDAPGLTEIKVKAGNAHFEAAEGVLYNKGKTTLICYPRKKSGTPFIVPASVTTIGAYAVFRCAALESITLPDALETIGTMAFNECSALKSITIPKSVGTIEDDAFRQCTGLKSITIPKSVGRIGDYAFEECTALKDVTVAWETPLTIHPEVFKGITPLTDVTLHVPTGTTAAYRTKDVWKDFSIEEPPLPPTPTPEEPERPSTPDRPYTPKGKRIDGITLSASSFVLDGERTFRFTATITPSDAADKRLICTSDDETIVRVRALPAEETRRGLRSASDPAVITYEGTVYGVGHATITVKSTDGSALVVTCPVDVRRLPTSTVAVTPTRLYASDGQLHLTLPASVTVRIYHVSGQLVRTFLAPAGDSSVQLPAGVYVVKAGDRAEKVVVD